MFVKFSICYINVSNFNISTKTVKVLNHYEALDLRGIWWDLKVKDNFYCVD